MVHSTSGVDVHWGTTAEYKSQKRRRRISSYRDESRSASRTLPSKSYIIGAKRLISIPGQPLLWKCKKVSERPNVHPDHHDVDTLQRNSVNTSNACSATRSVPCCVALPRRHAQRRSASLVSVAGADKSSSRYSRSSRFSFKQTRTVAI